MKEDDGSENALNTVCHNQYKISRANVCVYHEFANLLLTPFWQNKRGHKTIDYTNISHKTVNYSL